MNKRTIQQLAASHDEFMGFLVPRVESRAVAEDILQAAFSSGLQAQTELKDPSSAVAYFYQLLRRALVDHYRRRSAEGRAKDRASREAVLSARDDHALEHTVCACVERILTTLPPAQAELLRAVDLNDSSVSAFAKKQRITPNAAMVRLHRARATLRQRLLEACGTCCTHLCVDCECRAG